MMRKALLSLGIVLSCFCTLKQSHAQALHWLTQPSVSIGEIANGRINEVKISANGRYISFTSSASNLVVGDTNGRTDVFIRDLLLGTVERVNVTSTGQQQTDSSIGGFSAPTSDGRYVAFSTSSPIFPDALGGASRLIYVKDLQTGQVVNESFYDVTDQFRVSIDDIFLSDDRRYLVFTTTDGIDPLDNGFGRDVYRKDTLNDTYELLSISSDGLSPGDDTSEVMSVAPNGQYVLMESEATNLVNETLNNTRDNLYVRDLNLDMTSLINRTPAGQPSACDNSLVGTVANNGWVAFSTACDDLVNGDTNQTSDVFLYDGVDIERISLTPANQQTASPQGSGFVAISLDGTKVAYEHGSDELSPLDNNGDFDVYVYDTGTQSSTLVSVSTTGASGDERSRFPVISANGQTIAFISKVPNLTNQPTNVLTDQVYSYELDSGTLTNQSQAAFVPNTIITDVQVPLISSDQNIVVYSSQSPNLVQEPEGDALNDLFLLDRTTNTRSIIARNVLSGSSISGSGRYVMFFSRTFPPAGTLDLGASFLFLLDRNTGTYTQIAENAFGVVNNQGLVLFHTNAALVVNDTNNERDVYVFDSSDQSIALVSENTSGNAANNDSSILDISESNGTTWLLFWSRADDLINADQNSRIDIFLSEWPSGNITRVSQTPAGTGGDSNSVSGKITPDGEWVAFLSEAENLTGDDYTDAEGEQVFRYRRLDQTISLVSKTDQGLPLDNSFLGVTGVGISDSGRYIAYDHQGDYPTLNDNDNNNDVFLYDTVADSLSIVSRKLNGVQTDEFSIVYDVVEDLTVSPPLLGVLFSTRGAELADLDEHPGYEEVFLYQQGGPNVDLDVQVQGPGSVSGSLGINCQDACAYDYALGTDLSIVASPDVGAEFLGWVVDFGDCGGSFNPCFLLMDRSKTLTARFVDSSDLIFRSDFE